MHVIGTAGHVDHGKSSLVHALTGIDPDRLKEEKSRGMTIDLGFAWIELPSVNADGSLGETENVGVVDVPGHIDFIKNMLAGVGGIDTALLVIAADEGVMPQTREHLAILDLLAVPSAVVALTKTDLIDEPEWLDLVELDVAELLQETHLADAPIVRVSATTGDGLDELRHTLAATLGQLPRPLNRTRPRLPVDRVFTLSGFGTVVTGTLHDGHFKTGDSVEILPEGLPARIRGLQTHRQQIAQAAPASRVAINLSGVSADEVHRGQVVAAPDTLQSTLLIDVDVRLLPDAPKAIVHNQAVTFYSGATESSARIRLLGAEKIEPGQSGWLQLRLGAPIVAASGDRFILRQPSPSITLGGGRVLSPHPRRRWKRFDPAVIERMNTLAQGAPDEILLQTLARQPLLTRTELFVQSSLDLDAAAAAFDELSKSGAIVELGGAQDANLLTLAAWGQVEDALLNLVSTYHRQYPLRQGMPRSEARSRLQSAAGLPKLSVRVFNAMLERVEEEGLVFADDVSLWRSDYAVALTECQSQQVDQLLATFARDLFSPPNAGDALAMLGGDDELMEMLIEQGRLVRLGGGVLFAADAFAEMVERIEAHARGQGSITLAETRDLFQTSRKYAQAVLEEMDARRITRREGDVRVLRAG